MPGKTWVSTLPPGDDGEGAALRLLQRSSFITEDRETSCEDIAFRVLAANNTPDFRTISDFRKDHLKSLAGLFFAGIEAVSESRTGETGSCSSGWNKNKSQCLQSIKR